MRLDMEKKFVDYILTVDIDYAEAVILEFIGGKPSIRSGAHQPNLLLFR